MNASQQRNGN